MCIRDRVGDLALDGLDGLGLVDGLHMEVHQNAAVRIEKIRQHFIRQLWGEDLQEAHRAVFSAHAKGFCIAEAQGGRGDKVLGGKAGGGHPLPVKIEQLPVRVLSLIHILQTIFGFSVEQGNRQTGR